MRIRRLHIVKCIVACAGALLAGVLPQLASAQDAAALPYLNPKLPAEQRAADLVHRMTLAEKASEMQNNSAAVARLNIPAYQA
jgi:beta-glucosidase